ncbi:saccharopine dehydrogenase family protein [Marinicella gelatinilytica]|uniref:saccharopine dehydrogenase family protein n=1 Tax=Marinicella gelatinilytica TaxID=2996017 RepID=UPI0022609B7C|nr:saccharopine dehydrogenase NADP-binding domain-containing protein [Marinicella gelatinilytica]MCX7544818.1 saccharopine dehydrogenase NADP-binding domain-containing protein [Marinicella gelatinilytica]
MTQKQQWLLYGAYGYTGELIARQAVKDGLQPILAGRDSDKTADLAQQLGLSHVVFSVSDLAGNNDLLKSYDLVLNCAGPFSQTADIFMDACIEAQCHYFDITGEIGVFEAAAERHQPATLADIILCPGVGFDVIPTDCMAAMLKQAMPDATHLNLGFDSRSGFSPGTAKTSVEALPEGGRIREDGLIKEVPLAYKTRRIDFGGGQKLAMTIPWGDVATAYYSTEIQNIEVYIPASPRLVKRLKKLNWIRPILAWSWVQNRLKKRIEKTVKGPDEQARQELTTFIWGEVSNATGERLQKRMQVANGYQLTVDGSLHVVKAVLSSQKLTPGYQTPSRLFGADLIKQLPGTQAVMLNDT